MQHFPVLKALKDELQFLGAIASCTGSVDAELVREQLPAPGTPAEIFARARDEGATQGELRSFLLSVCSLKAGSGEPLLTLDAKRYLQRELWQINAVRPLCAPRFQQFPSYTCA